MPSVTALPDGSLDSETNSDSALQANVQIGRVVVDLQYLNSLQAAAQSVHLSTVKLRRFTQNPLIGQHRSTLRGRGLDFQELRHYHIGDDIRHIDWKVSNRTRVPHVRSYTEERERPIMLLVDQRQSMFFGSQRAMKSVVATEMAAIIAWQALRQNDLVGGLFFSDEHFCEFAPRQSKGHLMQMFKQLVSYNQALQGVDSKQNKQSADQLNKQLKQLIDQKKRHCLIYLISDLVGANQTTTERLNYLARNNDIVVSVVSDPLEINLPLGGQLAVSNGQQQLVVDTQDSELSAKLAQAYQQRVSFAAQLCKTRAILLFEIDTVSPMIKQLSTHLSRLTQ